MSDDRNRLPLTVAEIALFLGLTPVAVRQIIRREQIPSVGKRGRAKLYWTHAITNEVGAHDRRLLRKRRPLCNTSHGTTAPKMESE